MHQCASNAKLPWELLLVKWIKNFTQTQWNRNQDFVDLVSNQLPVQLGKGNARFVKEIDTFSPQIVNMNAVETYMHNKCMGLYGNLASVSLCLVLLTCLIMGYLLFCGAHFHWKQCRKQSGLLVNSLEKEYHESSATDAGLPLGKKYLCAQSEGSILMTNGTGLLIVPSQGPSRQCFKTFAAIYPDPTDQPWVS